MTSDKYANDMVTMPAIKGFSKFFRINLTWGSCKIPDPKKKRASKRGKEKAGRKRPTFVVKYEL